MRGVLSLQTETIIVKKTRTLKAVAVGQWLSSALLGAKC
jgi:hypothetical protein